MNGMLMKKINSLDWENPLITSMQEFFALYVEDANIVNMLTNQVVKTLRRFEDGQYHFLPIYNDGEITDETYTNIIIYKLENHLEKYAFLFNEFESEYFRIKSISINSTKSIAEKRTVNISNQKGGVNTSTETNSGTDTTTYTGTSNGMSENSPIDADINSITTPDIKSKSGTTGETKYERGGVKEIQTNLGENNIESGTDNLLTDEKRFSPYEFDMFIKAMKNLNVLTIITNCIRKVIKEFNTAI